MKEWHHISFSQIPFCQIHLINQKKGESNFPRGNLMATLVIFPLNFFFAFCCCWSVVLNCQYFPLFWKPDSFVLYLSSDTDATVAAQMIWLLLFSLFHVVLKEASNCCFAWSNLAETGFPPRDHLCCCFYSSNYFRLDFCHYHIKSIVTKCYLERCCRLSRIMEISDEAGVFKNLTRPLVGGPIFMVYYFLLDLTDTVSSRPLNPRYDYWY